MKTTKLFFLFISLAMSFVDAATVKCPVSPNAFEPVVTSQVSFDKKTNLYTYKYSIKNLGSSKVPIFAFYVQTIIKSESQKSPVTWTAEGLRSNWIKGSMDWSGKDIDPGQSLSGFELQSKYPPGITKYAMLGSSDDDPTVVMEADADEAIVPVCPGFYLEGSSAKSPVPIGITIGPVPPSRIIARIRIKRSPDKKYQGYHDEEASLKISPLDTGLIQVVLLGDKDLDVTKISLDTLRFGQGEAKPVKTSIVDRIKEDGDAEMNEHLKKNKFKNLLMEFNLKDVNVLCDVDRALFLTGKYETKDLFGAVKIKHVLCDKKTFSKEEKLIKKDGTYKIKD